MAIYKVSFPSPHPVAGEDAYDVVDTMELKNTKLNDDSITQCNEAKTMHIIKYEFGQRMAMPSNKEEIFIKASCSSIDVEVEEKLDIQTFVDEVARGAYQRKTPDSSTYIIEAKTKLKTAFASKLLEQGCLAINTRYNSFGYIYSGVDKIGTFENINIISETQFTIDDSQSIVELDNANSLSMQLNIEKQYPFLIEIDSMRSKTTAVLKSITNLDSGIPQEVLDLKLKDEYSTEEEFLAARRSMINTDLVEDNYSLDDMDI